MSTIAITEDRELPLSKLVDQWTQGQNKFETPIAGLTLHRWDAPYTADQLYSGCESVYDRSRKKAGDLR